MNNYSTFGNPNNNKPKTPTVEEEEEEEEDEPLPNLYASPIVSSALITAFGLPTLVEYEAPSTSSANTPGIQEPSSLTSNNAPEEHPSASEFTRIHNNNSSRRVHSKSLPTQHIIQPSTNKQQSPLFRNRRCLSQSATLLRQTRSDDESSSTNNRVVASYTYRVRASTFGDEHHYLLMIQNEDGSYSHANVVAGEPFATTINSNAAAAAADDDDDDDYADNCLGRTFQNESKDAYYSTKGNNDSSSSTNSITSNLIQMTTPQQPQDNNNIVPLHLLTETETPLNEEGHVPLPSQILHPQYTSTTPALKLWPLAILVFYNVSGGPFGIEPSIRAAGNFYAILGFSLFPLIWSLPEALVTAELGSTFQDPSAGVAWVEEAFGERMGSLCGYLAWVSGATDNAIYPTLFLEYVTSVMGCEDEMMGGFMRFGLVGGITICLSLLNYAGLEIVGKASLVVCVIAMSPFVLMTILGAPRVVPSRWLQMPVETSQEDEDGSMNNRSLFDDDFQTSPGPLPLFQFAGILWRPFMNNLFWNLNSFDNAASFAGETTDVTKTYPRGIFIGLIMTVIFYVVPLMVAVGATDYTQSDWVDGHLGAVAVDIGGPWLGAWTIFAAGISNLALFEAELSADAFQLMGMAERGYLPKIFQKRSRYGTPTTGIIVGTVVIILFGCADFGQLLELLNANYAVSLLMEYAAFIKLRLFRKELERPYRIPLPDWAAVLITVPPCVATIAIILISNWYVYIFTSAAIIFGILLFKVGEIAKRKGWFVYEIKGRGYAMPPMDDSRETMFDPSSSAVANHEGEWEYGGENRIS